jgi:DNA-binding response OmpR family regulator
MSYILLIEDNQDNANMIRHLLTSAGYEVRHSLHGLEGSRMAFQDPPRLIILDFNLPDIDGRTLILSLKKKMGANNEAPKIISCTARTSSVDRAIAERYGSDGFLGKPFQPEELLTMVKFFMASDSEKTDS